MSLSVQSFVALRSAVWPADRAQTDRQTETKHEINGLLGLGCKASRSLGRGPTDTKHENNGLLGRLRLARFAARSLAGRGPTHTHRQAEWRHGSPRLRGGGCCELPAR